MRPRSVQCVTTAWSCTLWQRSCACDGACHSVGAAAEAALDARWQKGKSSEEVLLNTEHTPLNVRLQWQVAGLCLTRAAIRATCQ